MPAGYWGKILRVDLSTEKIEVEAQDEKFYRTYLGGRGIIAQYLLKEVPAGCDPLGPDNILVFAASVLTGTSLPGAARVSAGAMSPLTGGYGEGEGGGYWGVKLRKAGYDALVVSGASAKPVYLHITDQGVELRDASHLWGMEAFEAQNAIRKELDDAKLETAIIGPGAENLVKFGCIAVGMHDYIGRAGLGAVMGAKKLKAVAVNGKQNPEVADKDGLKKIIKWMVDNYEASLGTMTEMGTARGVPVLNAAGALPTRNFQEGSFEEFESLTGRNLTDTLLVDRKSCFACPVRCKRVVEVHERGLEVGRSYGGPEYESVAGFGSNCGISDLKAVCKANETCNRYTVDTISSAMMISGAMECAEKGLLPQELTQGLDLRFGSIQGMLDLLDQIVNHQGLGAILAEGPKNIADKLGEEAAACFLHCKGQPLPLQEPRWKVGMGMGYALSPTGAEHMANMHDVLYSNEEAPSFNSAKRMGIYDAVGSDELGPAKARMWAYMAVNRSLTNILTICAFMPYDLNHYVAQVRAVTGWDVSSWELVKVSERALAMARAFNAKQGLSVDDDYLPTRMFEPLKSGALKGQCFDRDEFEATKTTIYDMLGWDHSSGAPKGWKLHELGVPWLTAQDSK